MLPPSEAMIRDWQERAEKAEAEIARLQEPQPCTHPAACVVSSDTSYCSWCADVARLREALEAAAECVDTFTPDWPVFGKFVRADKLVQAALSTPADEWLTRHDEEVRVQERERCAGKCDEVAARWREAAELHSLDIDYGRRDGAIFCAERIRQEAAAIREATE